MIFAMKLLLIFAFNNTFCAIETIGLTKQKPQRTKIRYTYFAIKHKHKHNTINHWGLFIDHDLYVRLYMFDCFTINFAQKPKQCAYKSSTQRFFEWSWNSKTEVKNCSVKIPDSKLTNRMCVLAVKTNYSSTLCWRKKSATNRLAIDFSLPKVRGSSIYSGV